LPRVAVPPGRGYPRAARTRARILEAALRVFAEHGYRRGTLRDVCRRAGVNGAMANYHFRSKAGLYRAALREAVLRVQKQTPIPMDASPPRDRDEARERLRAVVRGFASGLLASRASPHRLLLLREMAEPSRALDAPVHDLVRPRFEALRAAVKGLAPDADEEAATWATLSVLGQIAWHRAAGPVVLRLLGKKSYGRALVDEVVARVTEFSERALGLGPPAGGDVA
jgi:AcrR family transcriptional regulator